MTNTDCNQNYATAQTKMRYKFKIKQIAFFALIIISFVSGCNYNSEKNIDKVSKLLPNGKHLMVEKTNEETTAIGIFTKHDYGTTHQFSYKFSIDDGDVIWDGGSGEPKNILFCEDTIYIRYLANKYIQVESTDSINNTSKYDYHFEIKEVFQKHIDKRYFFKLLGDDYWVDILPEDYACRKISCDEYPIPNNCELSLPPVTKEAGIKQ
ncbi:hypothetical protein [Labilibaculum euxinus]